MTDESQYRHWVDKVREYRETVLYPKLFGHLNGVSPLPSAYLGRKGEREGCPRHWLSYGILAFEPSAGRESWLYVTSGMSDDFQEDVAEAQSSGLGCEFVMETRGRCELAIDQLHYLMAQQLLTTLQRGPKRHPLGDFDRLPLLESSGLVGSRLRWLMLGPPRELPQEASLHSGQFDFYQVTAISDAESDYARSRGGPALLAVLERAGAYPVVDWMRTEVV